MWQLIYRALKAEVKQFGLFILVKYPGGGRVGKVNRSILHNSVGVEQFGKKLINKCALRGCNCLRQPLRNSSERGHRLKLPENEFCLSFPPSPIVPNEGLS